MARHSPFELNELSAAEARRKAEAKRADRRAQKMLIQQEHEAKQIAIEKAEAAKRVKEESHLIWYQILKAAMSLKYEVQIKNPTATQLNFLSSKGFDWLEIYKRGDRAPSLRAKLKNANAELAGIDEQIQEVYGDLQDEMTSHNLKANDWVEKNTGVAFQSSLEPWFGEELNFYFVTDHSDAICLRDHIVGEISSSHETKKISKLKALKLLVERQLKTFDRFSPKLTALETESERLTQVIAGIENNKDLYAMDDTDATHWVSWKDQRLQQYWVGDPEVDLLKWVLSATGQSFLDAVDSMLVKKASLGEQVAVFLIGEKASFDVAESLSDIGIVRYGCDGFWVSARGPQPRDFVDLMQASGYHALWQTMPDNVDQVTVSWGK